MSDTIDPMITDEQDAKSEGRATAGGDVPGPRLDHAGQQRLAEQLVEQARAQGLDLAGADGLLAQLTKRVLETALEAEMVSISAMKPTRARDATVGTPATAAGRRRS